MNEVPCRYCDKRNSECHGNCKEYLEWAKENEKFRRTKYEKDRISFLSNGERPKRRHSKR